MAIIRNLSASNIALNDIGGITISASSDYDLQHETRMDISNSKDLNNSITSGDVVFLDNAGNPLSQQISLNILGSISITQPPISIEDNGVAVAGNPQSILNFLNHNITDITGSSPGIINIDFVPNTEIRTIDGENFLMFVDTSRSNKLLSVEKVNYIFYKGSVQDLTYLIYNYFTTASIEEGIVVPKDATIVGVSALWLSGGAASVAYEYDLYIDRTLTNSNIFLTSGNSESTLADNTLDIDVSAGQKIKIRARNVGTGEPQNSVTVFMFIRWRV